MTSVKEMELALILRPSDDARELALRGDAAQDLANELLQRADVWRERRVLAHAGKLIERLQQGAMKEDIDLEPVHATLARLRGTALQVLILPVKYPRTQRQLQSTRRRRRANLERTREYGHNDDATTIVDDDVCNRRTVAEAIAL